MGKLTFRKKLAIRSAIEEVPKRQNQYINRLGISPVRINIKSTKKELLGLQVALMSSAKTQANKSTFLAISLMRDTQAASCSRAGGDAGAGCTCQIFSEARGRSPLTKRFQASRRITLDPSFRQVVDALHDLKVEHPKPAAEEEYCRSRLLRSQRPASWSSPTIGTLPHL